MLITMMRNGNILRQISPLFNLERQAISSFRTGITNPVEHDLDHSAQFYTIDPQAHKQLFSHGGFPKSYEKQVKSFGEPCLMVRRPALEIINCIKNIDFSKPTLRFALYGKLGSGKSLSLAHVMHYAMAKDFLIIHVPWVPNWFRRPKETVNSTTQEGFMDLPLDGAAWLIHFKTQNSKLLDTLKLTVSQEYVWSKREITPQGALLSDIIDHGINRIKYASECIAAILREIKIHSTQGKCKTLVAIDGFNGFFDPVTKIRTDNKAIVPPNKVTLTTPFLDITKPDWCNGISVVTLDELALSLDSQKSHLPRYLLGKEGFEHLDPFVPVEVENYNDKEYISAIEYYRDRRWLQASGPQVDIELKYLSGQNPFKLMELCGPL